MPKSLDDRTKCALCETDTKGTKYCTKCEPPPANNSFRMGAHCQEASTLSKTHYIACGQLATAIIGHKKDGRTYYMCGSCADHNIRSRGGTLLTSRQIEPLPSISDRIKAATASAPSMVPDTPAPPPPPAALPDMIPLISDPKQRLTIARMIARHAELGESLSAMKKERDKLTEAIKPLMGKLKLGKAAWGDYRLSYFSTPRASLEGVKVELLNRGVQPNILTESILAATKDSYTLRISRGGDGEGDGE